MADRTGKKEHTSFVMYKEWARHFKVLEDAEIGKLMRAVFDFVIDGEDTEFKERTLLVIFSMMKECFSRDEERWIKKCEKNSENVKKRWEKNTNVNDSNEPNTKNTESESESVNESEYASVSESEYESANDFSQVRITENELNMLCGLADRQTIENYLSKIRDWQTKNRRFNSKPYTSIRKWLDEDGVIKEPPRRAGGGFGDYYPENNSSSQSKELSDDDRYAMSIDYSKESIYSNGIH